MKGEDKIFLLEAYLALNNGDRDRWEFTMSQAKRDMLVRITKTYTREEFNEEVAKIKELCNG